MDGCAHLRSHVPRAPVEHDDEAVAPKYSSKDRPRSGRSASARLRSVAASLVSSTSRWARLAAVGLVDLALLVLRDQAGGTPLRVQLHDVRRST